MRRVQTASSRRWGAGTLRGELIQTGGAQAQSADSKFEKVGRRRTAQGGWSKEVWGTGGWCKKVELRRTVPTASSRKWGPHTLCRGLAQEGGAQARSAGRLCNKK